MKRQILISLLMLIAIQFVNAQTATNVQVLDTRSDNTGPNGYSHEAKFEFKRISVLGVPVMDGFSGLLTFAPWYSGDNSGNSHHQLNFNDRGIFYRNGLPQSSTWNPWQKLIIGDASGNINIPGVYNIEQIKLGQYGNGSCGLELINHSDATNSYGVRLFTDCGNGGYAFQIQTASPTNSYQSLSYTTRLLVSINGNVGIGVINPDSKLTVNGTIHASEVKVDLNMPADYVFKSDYKLMPLNEVEEYLKTYSHLPEIPSALEIKQNGLSLGEMQNKLLQKVEELTLYTIEQNKKLQEQEKKNAELAKKIEELSQKLK